MAGDRPHPGETGVVIIGSAGYEDPWDLMAFNIGYALSRSRLKVKGQSIETCRRIADQVVEHLKLCGWDEPCKKPPAGGHSTS